MEKCYKKELISPGSFIKNYEKVTKKNLDFNILSLVDIGSKGHFPLFSTQWFEKVFSRKNSSSSDIYSDIPSHQEIETFEKIFLCITNQGALDRKIVQLFSLNEDERDLFTHVFLKLVESKILDQKPFLH